MSEVGWIVGSLKERDAAQEFLSKNTDIEPRDELHIGPLRDAISDALFPGVTTQQTRAKYFLFGALICRRIEGHRRSRRPIWTQLREAETEVLEALKERPQVNGIIGSQKWKIPGRGPTSIYWHGLYKWGLRTEDLSMPRYVAWLGGSRRLSARFTTDESEQQELSLWNPHLGHLESTLANPSLRLSREEASFLRDCILQIRNTDGRALLKDLAARKSRVAGDLWDLAPVQNESVQMADLVGHAAWLSAAIEGGMNVYNYLCATKKGDTSAGDWARRCRDWRREWPAARWRQWDLLSAIGRFRGLTDGPRGLRASERFVRDWYSILSGGRGFAIHTDRDAVRLITRRERAIKGRRARLANPPGPALDSWEPQGVGAGRMHFRWNQAKRILNDVSDGLAGRSE